MDVFISYSHADRDFAECLPFMIKVMPLNVLAEASQQLPEVVGIEGVKETEIPATYRDTKTGHDFFKLNVKIRRLGGPDKLNAVFKIGPVLKQLAENATLDANLRLSISEREATRRFLRKLREESTP